MKTTTTNDELGDNDFAYYNAVEARRSVNPATYRRPVPSETLDEWHKPAPVLSVVPEVGAVVDTVVWGKATVIHATNEETTVLLHRGGLLAYATGTEPTTEDRFQYVPGS